MTFLLCANQRSGTHALKNIMENNADYFDLGEVLNPFDREQETNFFYWLEARAQAQNYASGLTHDTANDMTLAFINYLLSFGDRVLVDIKYNNFGALDPSFFFRSQAPMFLAHWMERSLPIVHLRREDLFGVYVSDLVKAQIGINHAYVKGDGKTLVVSDVNGGMSTDIDVDNFIDLDPIAARNYMDLVDKEENLFSSFLSNYPRVTTLTYESMLIDNVLSESARSELNGTLQISLPESSATWMRRIPVRYSDMLKNRSEIEQYFSHTKYKDMIANFFA